MRNFTIILGILLIILGITGFSYRYFTYTTNEKIASIGNIQVTAEKEKSFSVSPLLSGVFLIGGIFLIVAGRNYR